MTVVEAMASGCPVIISNQVNIWRRVKKNNAGVVVSLNPFAVAAAIIQVFADPSAARAMGRRGRMVAKKYFAITHIVTQLTSIYRKLIEGY